MKKYIVYIVCFFLVMSCDDIVEKDISKETVFILSPQDQFRSESSTINFFWDYVEGANEYQLEVVKGRFDSVVTFVLDTFIRNNKFTANFNPGEYEWSLRAVNSEYSTNYSVRSFSIDSSSNLSESSIILQFPSNGSVFADSALTLSWGEIFGVESYLLRVNKQSNGQLIIIDTVSENYYFTGAILSTGKYDWQVKGINAQSETQFSKAIFEIDQVNPVQPVLISPLNQTFPTISPLITFDWQSELDLDASFDSIYIRRDTVNSVPFKYKVTESKLTLDSLSANTYKWKVKSFDKAGNSSVFSDEWVFKVQ